MREPKHGTVKAPGILQGVRVELVRATPAGTIVARVLTTHRAYLAGDVVHLGGGDIAWDNEGACDA